MEPSAGPITPHSPSHYAAAGEGLVRQREPTLPRRLPHRAGPLRAGRPHCGRADKDPNPLSAPPPRLAPLALAMTDVVLSQPQPGQDACVHKRLSPRFRAARAQASPPRPPGPAEAQIAPPGLGVVFPGVPPLPVFRGALGAAWRVPGDWTRLRPAFRSDSTAPPHSQRATGLGLCAETPLGAAGRQYRAYLRMTLLGSPSVVSREFAGKPPPVSFEKRLRKARRLGP